MSFVNLAMFTATLADKGEEPPSPSSSSEPSSLLNSTSSFSSIFPSFLTSDITTIITLSAMPSKNSQITFQKLNQIPSTTTNLNENNPIHNLQQEKNDYANTNIQSPIPQRRLPLPNKLTFEQNITNLIEKESPLLQSELLTAEHELSVLRSRLAVNEGVTAVTGSILESLKEQFESHHKIDRPTSTFDISPTNLLQYSSGIQTSPSLEALPDPLEIHYDGESPKNPYFVIKANNSFWLAQPINHSDVEKHLKKFSSPVMKHASIKLPDDFDFDDIDKDSISDENESSTIDRQEQLAEMKTIRSSSIIQPIDQFDKFEDKIDEIYSLIDSFKHHKLTPKIFHTLEKNIQDLKLIMHDIPCNKQDELRIEYEFDELENLFHQTTYQHEDYNLIELFEQNLNELQHIIEQIKTKTSPIQRDVIIEFENKLKSIQTKSKPRLIPENPVVTKDVFFEGDKISKIKKTSPSNIIRLIPEDPQINASSFYEGDIRRSFYHPPHQHSEHERKVLIPEKPLVSSEVFYEGDPQRSMFIERPNLSHPEYFSTPPVSIDHLRDIMSDLMLAASWSKKPRLEKQPTKDDVEIHAESFITTEEQHTKSPVCEITHEIENFSLIHPSILIEPNEEMVVIDKPDQESSDMAFAAVSPSANEKEQYDNLLIRTSVQIVEQVFNEIISEEQNQLYHQTAVNIVNDVLENILTKNDDELHSIKSSSSEGENEEESPEEYSPSDDEENEKLIPQISDQPYLFVTEVVTSKSTQELGNLVQELQVLEHQIHDIHILSSSSSSLSEDDQIPSLNLPIPQIATTKSVNELTTLVSELQTIEEQLEDKLTSPDKTNQSPISSKSFNELGGLINELKTVSNRLHEEIFTSNNIDLLSEDIAKYRRDSLPIITDQYLQKKEREQYEFNENQLVQEMVGQIIKEAQQILLAELSSNASQSTVKCVPTIIVDERRAPYHQLSATSISDDLDISHEDSAIDRTFELAAQLDYLRRMSRYENLMNQYDELQKSSVPKETFIDQNLKKEPSSSDEDNYETLSYQQLEITEDPINQRSTDSLMFHSTEDIEENTSTTIFDRVKSFVNKPIEIIQEVIENRFTTDHLSPQPPHHHFQSAYDLHDEEKSKLVRSPELYNMDNVIKHDHRSLSTNSQIQYRTLSESALAVDDSKRHSLTTATSNEASVEYLTTISKENSLEFMQLQRAPTPFDDVLEKESSPEHSESYNPPTSAFSDAFEPTSSCQRPLAIFTSNQQRIITDLEYETVANDLVNQVLNDVVTELITEQDNSSLSTKSDELSISSSTSSDDIDQIFQEQGELFINNKRYVHQESTSPKTSTRSSFSKILRRAQTDITDVDIVPSPRALNPPLIRRNSQSDTETYFHGITPTIHDYIPMDNSSSDEKSSAKTRHLSFKHNEKYSGEGEESSGGKARITQRRKRSNDNTNTYESPPIKNLAFKFETNDNFNRQESLDSPTIDSNEKNIFKILQESIFRTNLESFQIDLKFISQQKENLQEKTYSSTTKKSLSYYDYDGGSETDRDDSKILPLHQKVSIDTNVKNLLDELIETIHDDLTISSPSDVTTVIFNSNTMSLDEEDNSNLIDKEGLSSSSSSSSHTVIYHQQNLTSFVNTNAKQQSSINSNTKKKFHSYPGSLVPITSISSIPTTSTTFQSGKQQFDE